MLAAGKGERFRKQYTEPKPLIIVDGKAMVVRASEFLPDASQYVYLCLSEHLHAPYLLDKKIKNFYPEAKIISVDQVTLGQASTAFLAKDSIDPNASLTIASCDCGALYDKKAFIDLLDDSKTDAIVWTFRNNVAVKKNPNAWGWVKANKDGFVEKISVKAPISDDVMNDHAIIGWFSFKKADDCFLGIEEMIADQDMVNNEYYLDRLLARMVSSGKNVRIFEVDTYLGWGTPEDLQAYEKKS